MEQLSGRPIEDADVTLIRRRVADVAASGGDDMALRVVEWRRNLLARGQARDRGRPQDVAIADRELFDSSVGRRGIDRGPIGISDWGDRKSTRLNSSQVSESR